MRIVSGWIDHLFVAGLSLSLAAAAIGCDKKEAGPTEAATTATALATSTPAEPVSPAAAVDAMKVPTLPTLDIPKDNPQTDAKVALGHQLFFDKRLSVDGSRSCYECHQNDHGTGGKLPLAVGAEEKQLTRHSPVLWNVGYLAAFYWDGRASTLEAQMKGAWGGANMGVGADNLEKKAAEIAKIPGYAKQFKEVFADEGVTPDTIAKAVAAYERTLICKDTAYDKYAAGDKAALTDEQKTGLYLFMGKAGCVACHAPPQFTTATMGKGTFFNTGIGTDAAEPDIGRMKVTEKESDWAAFKPPTLRNSSKSAPYFHDGSVKTLKEAVVFMASGGRDNKNKSPLLQNKQLTDDEINQIVAFLGALECGKLEEPELPK